MPAANHSFYLRNCYLKNNADQGQDGPGRQDGLARRRENPDLQSRDQGRPYRAGKIGLRRQPVLRRQGRFHVAGSGHIAGVVNPPDKGKYQFWTGGPTKGDFDDWVARAKETPGSWWPHWHAWIEAKDAKRVPARKPGGTALNAIEDAPGSYVMERA